MPIRMREIGTIVCLAMLQMDSLVASPTVLLSLHTGRLALQQLLALLVQRLD